MALLLESEIVAQISGSHVWDIDDRYCSTGVIRSQQNGIGEINLRKNMCVIDRPQNQLVTRLELVGQMLVEREDY